MNELSLRERINIVYKTLTEKELVVLTYITSSKVNSNNLFLKNVRAKCNVGYSTVYNLLKKLDFNSFKELTTALKIEELNNDYLKKELNNDSGMYDVSKIYLDVIKKNSQLLDKNENLEATVKLINKYKNIYILGFGESYLAGLLLVYRLLRFGKNATMLEREEGLLLTKIKSLSQNDLLIFVSISGETKIIIDAVIIAKELGIFIILITENQNSSIIKKVNLANILAFPWTSGKGEAVITPILPIFFFIDSLINKLINLNEKKYLGFREETSKLITSLTKIKK